MAVSTKIYGAEDMIAKWLVFGKPTVMLAASPHRWRKWLLLSAALCAAGVRAATAVTWPLNDTGMDWWADDTTNYLSAPPAGYPGQDASVGRDVSQDNDADGHGGFSFTKLDAGGQAVEATAASWSCVRDNVTGLTWEVKTADRGLRDKDWTYTWYNPDEATNGGSAGYPDTPTSGGAACKDVDRCDTAKFVADVNVVGLCGARDWRLPTRGELQSIVDYSHTPSSIDMAYFPDISQPSALFWSSSPSAFDPDAAWIVYFNGGNAGGDPKFSTLNHVRLVRDGGTEVPDQVHAPVWRGGWTNIAPANDTNQTFIPAKTPLTSVSVGIVTGNAGRGGDDLTLSIADDLGREIFNASQFVAEGFDGWLKFKMPMPGLDLNLGHTYALHLKDTGDIVFGWKYDYPGAYENGFGYFSDRIVGDYFFITFTNNLGVFTADRVGMWRPSTGRFYLDVDGSLTWNSGIDLITAAFGVATDRPVAGDWNGDGSDKIGVWRPGTGRFYLDMDGSFTWTSGVDVITAAFGVATDRPVAGDWNGDGTDEIGVWRPNTGRFYLDMDGSQTWTPGVDVITASFGVATDRPVAGDWDGDGTDEIGVWRPGTGRFYLDMDGSSTWTPGVDVITAAFGVATDRPVAGDWNDDSVDEIGVWRPSTGRFYLDVDGSRTWTPGVDVITDPFGSATDLPVAGSW